MGSVFPARVAQVLSPYKLVVNRGSREGVKLGQRLMVWAYGPEVVDPESGESLGRVEMVRGPGKVVHIQEKIAILESDRYQPFTARIKKRSDPFGILYGPETIEERLPPEQLPFEDAEVGDYAKPV